MGTSTPTTPTSWMCDVGGIRRAALVVAENTVVCSVTDVLFDGGYKSVVITGKRRVMSCHHRVNTWVGVD